MKKNLANRLLLLCGASLLLVGCPGPEPTPTPEPPVVNPPNDGGGDNDGGDPAKPSNSISFDGKTYDITAAGTDFEGATYLWFESGNDIEAYFVLFLEEGEFRITESQIFEYVSNPAVFELEFDKCEPGTFGYGAFYNAGDDEIGVTSGTIKVEVSGDSYTFEIDCTCEGGKELAIDYTGELEYYGPTGTSTIQVDDTVFPYVMVYVEDGGYDEDYKLYYSGMVIYGVSDLSGNVELDSEFIFSHSSSTLGSGTYDCISPLDPNVEAAIKDGIFVGYVGVWDWENEDNDIDTAATSGKVKIDIEDDIYTITFEDVELTDYGNRKHTLTGIYTGAVEREDYDSSSSSSYVVAKALKAKPQKAKPTKAKFFRRK